MRRVQRATLPLGAEVYLDERQQRLAAGMDVAEEWERARRSQVLAEQVFGVLRKMAGRRERCMYCNDSRGTDVEHFRPKAHFPDFAFRWKNMLLACTGCNRKKGDRFPLSASGEALLIDPSVEEPWEFLDFVPATGELTSRWRSDLGGFDPKGEATTDPVTLPLNIEAVTVGRQKSYRLLALASRRFLEERATDEDRGSVRKRLLHALQDHSDYGLERWVVLFEGAAEPPFSVIAKDYPEDWQWLRDHLTLATEK